MSQQTKTKKNKINNNPIDIKEGINITEIITIPKKKRVYKKKKLDINNCCDGHTAGGSILTMEPKMDEFPMSGAQSLMTLPLYELRRIEKELRGKKS